MGHTHSKELGNKWIGRTRELRSDKKENRKEEKEGEREIELKWTKRRKVHIRRERKFRFSLQMCLHILMSPVRYLSPVTDLNVIVTKRCVFENSCNLKSVLNLQF